MKKNIYYLFYFSMLFLVSLKVRSQEPVIKIEKLTDHVFVHISYLEFNGQLFACNGLYVVTDDGIVIIDTPADEKQTQQLIDNVKNRHHQKVVLCMVTHYHNDASAGLDLLKDQGIETWSSQKTQKLCEVKGEKMAENHFADDTTFHVGGVEIEAYYPGEGHTIDNVVYWFPESKVLFGGCLVKSVEAMGLGNVADANVEAWPETIKNVIKKYPGLNVVVPGHQKWSDKDALYHTLNLLSNR